MSAITNKLSLMVYGASNSGKSTQARYIAEFVHKTYNKKTRLIALDRGSLWSPAQDLVDQGIIIPLEFPTSYEFNPMAVMRKLRRGEWPEGGVINKPTASEIRRADGSVEIKYKTNTIWKPWTEKETAEIGAYVVDSWTSFATAFMSDTKQKNVRVGQDSGSVPRNEEGEQMGTNTISHYGDAHTEILDGFQSFESLPVHVTLFTALEGLGTDDSSGTKRPALGPETVGKAIGGNTLPSRVNHCFHLVAEGGGKAKVIKAWYDKHESEIPKLLWPAKVTLVPAELKEFWAKWPSGFIPLSLERGIGEFLEFINRKSVAVQSVGK
jgi:hypothetical protein